MVAMLPSNCTIVSELSENKLSTPDSARGVCSVNRR